MSPSERWGETQIRPEAFLGWLSIGLAAVTILQIDAVRVGLAPELTPSIVATSSLFFGCVVGGVVAWVLNKAWHSAVTIAVAAAASLPAATWFSHSQSPLAFIVASVAIAVTASQLLTASLALVARGMGWAINRYRQRTGRPTIEESARSVFASLGPDGRSALVLGFVASLVLTMSLFIDSTPDGQPGVIGTVAEAFGRLWSVLQGLSIGVLASAIVLYVRENPLVPSDALGADRADVQDRHNRSRFEEARGADDDVEQHQR